MTTEQTAPAPPTETGAAESQTPARTSTPARNSRATDRRAAHRIVPLPIRWAKELIEAADGPVPEYGSPEWHDLPDHSREKVASCVLSAERDRTRSYCTPEAWTFTSKRTREIAQARAPRPGDHAGGPVEW